MLRVSERLRQLAQSEYSGAVKYNVPLRQLTSWRIGGPADALMMPRDPGELGKLICALNRRDIPWMVLGKGTNILFSDLGFRGAIVRLGSEFCEISAHENIVTAGAGASLKTLAHTACEHSLAGLEPLSGIPGTVGAAAFLNAGAHGVNILDFFIEMTLMDPQGFLKTVQTLPARYRSSGLPEHTIITAVNLELVPGNPQLIESKMADFQTRRKRTQPLEAASAGCTFKNPSAGGAGRLIDGLGMKGTQIGQAAVSKKHANFLVNMGGATAEDIIDLITIVRQKVFAAHGVYLELEVRILDELGQRLDPGAIE